MSMTNDQVDDLEVVKWGIEEAEREPRHAATTLPRCRAILSRRIEKLRLDAAKTQAASAEGEKAHPKPAWKRFAAAGTMFSHAVSATLIHIVMSVILP
jgi:hypothetical protein